MFHVSKASRGRKIYLLWNRAKDGIPSGGRRANIGTGKRHVLTVGIDLWEYMKLQLIFRTQNTAEPQLNL